MNKLLKNFYDLYSNDDSVCYKALLEKKDWMFRKLFVPISFDKVVEDGKDLYPELYGVLDSSFVFKKLKYDKDIFSNLDFAKCMELITAFNNSYRYLNLVEKFTSSQDFFYVELETNKMDEKAYRELVANFYPRLTREELELKYNDNLIELLKLAMVGEDGYCLILGNDTLINDRYYLPIIKKLHYSKKMNQNQIEAVKEIAQSLGVDCYEYD